MCDCPSQIIGIWMLGSVPSNRLDRLDKYSHMAGQDDEAPVSDSGGTR